MKRGCSAEDAIIGQNMRQWRKRRGLSQAALGSAIQPAVSFQQIQKYEKGANRISAGFLLQISIALNCSIYALYKGLRDTDSAPCARVSDLEETVMEQAEHIAQLTCAARHITKLTLEYEEAHNG